MLANAWMRPPILSMHRAIVLFSRRISYLNPVMLQRFLPNERKKNLKNIETQFTSWEHFLPIRSQTVFFVEFGPPCSYHRTAVEQLRSTDAKVLPQTPELLPVSRKKYVVERMFLRNASLP